MCSLNNASAHNIHMFHTEVVYATKITSWSTTSVSSTARVSPKQPATPQVDNNANAKQDTTSLNYKLAKQAVKLTAPYIPTHNH